MDTIKTAFVVALLLAVLYGVYVVLNKEPAPPPPEVAEILKEDDDMLVAPDIDSGSIDDGTAAASEMDLPDDNLSEEVISYSPEETPGLPRADANSADVQPPRGSRYIAPADPVNSSEEVPYDPGQIPDDANLQNPLPEVPSPIERDSSPDSTYPETPEATLPEVRDPGSSSGPAPTVNTDFEQKWRQVQDEIQQEQFGQALLTASSIYKPELSDAQRKQLEEVLDPLAARVIYSRESFFTQPYTARGDETLEQIAQGYGVPWQLLKNINGVEHQDVLLSGTALKVVEGPFRAEVDSQRGELTLYLQQLYAGRFVITVGNEPRPEPGEYVLMSKKPGRPYQLADGTIIPANDADNPFGDVWMELVPKNGAPGSSANISIHGTAASGNAAPGQGCISLSPREAQDVYDILIEGSEVVILP